MWKVYNDTPVWLKPRRTLHYLSRQRKGKREDYRDARGRLRTLADEGSGTTKG